MIRILISIAVALIAIVYPALLAYETVLAAHGAMATFAVFCVPALGTAIIIEVLK